MTQPKIRLERTTDAALWDRLVTAHDGSVAFHTWAWLDYQHELLGLVIERLIVHADGEPVGVFPVTRRSRRSPVSPGLPFPFVGPLVPPQLLVATVRAVRRWQLRSGLVVARFDIGPADTGSDTAARLRRAGVDVVEDSTVVVELAGKSTDDLERGLSSQHRRYTKRATRDGVAVRDARPGEFATTMPVLLDEAYGVRGVPSPYPAALGSGFESWAAGRDWVTTVVATVDDQLAGAHVMLGGRPTALAWIGGAERRFRDARPNLLLYRAVLHAALEGGHATLDLCGWVDDGVGAFKLGFGGERRPYLVVRSTVGPRIVHQGLRRLLARVRR